MPLSGRCKRHALHCTPRIRGGRVIALALLFVALAPVIARADGDPASDVLASQPLFLAADANVPAIEQAQLAALLTRARARGFDLRVAVIASPSDLGSITELWRAPQSYARFLGQELALVGHGPLLVVMPNGYGSYGSGASVAGLSPPGRALGAGAIAAVQRLAAASGHPLGAVSVTAASPGGGGGTDAIGWVVFALGWVVIAGAWILSLRVRPLRIGRLTGSRV